MLLLLLLLPVFSSTGFSMPDYSRGYNHDPSTAQFLLESLARRNHFHAGFIEVKAVIFFSV